MLFHGGTPDHRAGSENQSDIADAERAVRCGFWLVESKMLSRWEKTPEAERSFISGMCEKYRTQKSVIPLDAEN